VIQIRVSITGQERLRQAFTKLAASIQDYSPAWDPITGIFQQAMRGQFASEGARGGKKWAPLSRGYARWKERIAPGRPILTLTGDLVLSLIRQTGDTIHEEQPLSLSLGTRLPYAKFHQRGTKRMPARPPIVLTRQDYDKMTANVVGFSAEYGLEAGFKLTNFRVGRTRMGRRRG